MATSDSIDVSKYSDLPMSGATFNYTGSKLQLTGVEAVKNVMKMYLLSEKGDYGRDLTKGGPLFDMIGKALTEDNKQQLTSKITTALQLFTSITLNTLDITLDRENKMFVVNLTFSDNYNKFIGNISLGVTGS